MLEVRSANCMDLAASLPRPCKLVIKRYQWIERFLSNDLVDVDAVMAPYGREVLKHLADAGQTVVLMIDQSKATDLHQMVMVSVRLGNRALPLAWRVKETQGAIGIAEQRKALEAVRAMLPEGVRVVLMGDRFYGSPDLIAWCRKQGWHWRLRLKQELLVFEQDGETTLGECFARGERMLSDIELTHKRVRTHVAMVHEEGHPEPWIIALSEAPTIHRAFDYGLRWGIEAHVGAEVVNPEVPGGHLAAATADRQAVGLPAAVLSDRLRPDALPRLRAALLPLQPVSHLATRQILDDVPMLQSYIDGRLTYGLALVEENQLLNGGGTGTDLHGVYTQATAFAPPITIPAPVTRIDVLRLAMLQTALSELMSTGVVLHPSDWAAIELLKDTTGQFIIGNPQGNLSPTLWGQPVVATQSMATGKFLTGAFQLGAQIFDRMDAMVEISTEDDQNFRKNLVTVLAEERLALAVYRPEAFVKGDFAAAATAATAA